MTGIPPYIDIYIYIYIHRPAWTWSISGPKTEINVIPGKSNLVSDQGFTKKEIELIGQDIRYMNTGPTDLVQKGTMNFNLLLTTYLLSLSVIIAPFMINKITGYRLATANDRKINNCITYCIIKLIIDFVIPF